MVFKDTQDIKSLLQEQKDFVLEEVMSISR